MIIVDLDGTIADCSHRTHYVKGAVKNWDAFNKACIHDKPIHNIIELVKRYVASIDTPVLFLTGRSDVVRKETEIWLNTHFPEMELGEDYMLVMRKEGDFRPDDIVKPELLNQFIESKFFDTDVHTIFEDRNSMVKKWRELGYTCFQVAEGDF